MNTIYVLSLIYLQCITYCQNLRKMHMCRMFENKSLWRQSGLYAEEIRQSIQNYAEISFVNCSHYYFYYYHHHHYHHLLYTGYCTYIPFKLCPQEYSVAAILLLLFMVLITLVSVLNLLYFLYQYFIIIIIISGPGSSIGIAADYCTVRDRIPVVTRFSARPDRPWRPPSLL